MAKAMDKLTEMIMTNDGLNETEAKAKLNYKAILQTTDHELHDMFLFEFKR